MIKYLKENLNYLNKNKFLYILIIPGIIITLFPFLFDGGYGCVGSKCGLIIGTNYRDGVWFLAIAATAFKSFPFRLPVFSGESLKGYHYLPNLIVYLLSLIGIPITISYYKITPLFYVFSLTFLSLHLARKINKKPVFVALFLFFIYFGIPLTLITSLRYYGYIKNSLLINTFQATRVLESPHTALSFLALLLFLIILNKEGIGNKERLVLACLLFFTLGSKFYTAVAMFTILMVYELINFWETKKLSQLLFSSLIFGLTSLLGVLIFYDPFASLKSGPVFKLVPFATVHHLIETPELFPMKNLVLARYYLYEHLNKGDFSPRLLLIELFSSFLFIVFYFGTRVLGFLYIFWGIIKRKLNKFETAVVVAILLNTVFSILLIQKGDWYNPIQFAVVASFLIDIFAAKLTFSLYSKYKKTLMANFIFLTIFILTFIPNLVNFNYLSNQSRYVIPQKEVEALRYLRKLPDGPIFSPIIDPDLAYVSAFTGKQTYLNFLSVLENFGINIEERRNQIKNIADLRIDKLKVKYVYIPRSYKDYQTLTKECQKSKKYKQIFSNGGVTIFKQI